MTLLVLDIGGTYVKYNTWDSKLLETTQKFKTPKTYVELKNNINNLLNNYQLSLNGIAISAPGTFNPKTKEIEGISAVPYLHNIKIIEDLGKTFNLPVTIENDANCAGICEMDRGIAKNYNNVAYLVLGTGVGGSIFLNNQLYRGSHNQSAEFGLTKNSSSNTLSTVGSIVKVANKYEKNTGKRLNGEQIYKLANSGDQLAIDLIDEMYNELALFVYNLQSILDVELIIIGGGVSAQKELSEAISTKAQNIFTEELVPDFMPEIKTSQYRNDANLIGAAISFKNRKY